MHSQNDTESTSITVPPVVTGTGGICGGLVEEAGSKKACDTRRVAVQSRECSAVI